ncbi:predicted protein [Verticillium alfalfae VaMs.102]|uniref:Predicted protein n=1 Tax=Verticillium alfalfae (strain VaMs.102 / ATCC MYA-4576 / FGSC 10136) TaxID=526221 RepID=C9SXJ1_VERA1|nr:predicted protein [Verticillium alfalfae VaMs.102]EEY23381.1 predicted protein [Verticillium alfalfae VaMs.102]
MPHYTQDDVTRLEMRTKHSGPDQMMQALAVVVGILERKKISYGVMGTMNLFLCGSGRSMGRVDIAVDSPPRIEDLLRLFDGHWAVGVAKIFVDVKGALVQFDLTTQESLAAVLPRGIARSVERFTPRTRFATFECKLLEIGPVVATILKSHYNLRAAGDYHDLIFIVTSRKCSSLVRDASDNFRQEWKYAFLEAALKRDPSMTQAISWALNMPHAL